MTEISLTQLVNDGWIFAALRLIFIGLIYLFLYLVLRATVGEMVAIGRGTGIGEASGSRAELEVVDGGGSSLIKGESWILQPVTTIGRVAGNEIVVDDPHVSARHAELRFDRGQWWLRDLGSSNGTQVNGQSVRSVVAVRHGDVLQCGRVRFSLATTFAVPVDRPLA